jgi:osmoprotectant transport system ATP-binding protein
VSLTAHHVSKRYVTPAGVVQALDDVSLDVGTGECVALVGESGSGKTTLLRCFNRLVDPDAGSVHVDAVDVKAADPVGLRRRIGYVQQEGGLLPHWTVQRNVELVPHLIDAPNVARSATDAMVLVGLDARAFGQRYPKALSGGQRQRVAMARALAAQPDVLLLDEPFGALDAITRAELQTMFARVRQRRPVTCVLVTHDLFEARKLADRIAVMRNGRIEQLAELSVIIERPATDYVTRLLEKAGIVRAPREMP